MLKFGVPLALAMLLGVFLFVGLQRDPSYVPSPLIGKQAPEFTLASLQDPNYPVASKELAGKTWVLNADQRGSADRAGLEGRQCSGAAMAERAG
jgi:hypothetical protein